MNLNRSFRLSAAAFAGALALLIASAPNAHADSVSYTVTVPAVSGAEVCLEVDGSERCATIAGLVGGTLTVTLDGSVQGSGPTFAPILSPDRCEGRPGAGISLTTGSFGGTISASIAGQNPANGEAVNQVLAKDVEVANHSGGATLCQK